MPVPQAFQAEKAALTVTYRGRGARATADGWEIVAFHATAGTRRAEFGTVRDLGDELGGTTGVDVTLEIDVEALAAPAAP